MCSARFWLFCPILLVMEANGLKHNYDDFTPDVGTRQFVWADSTLLEFFSGKNITIGCLSSYSHQSRICIHYTNRKQWCLCHVTPLNKGESTGIVEANYSLPKVHSPGKKLQLDNLELESVENQYYGTPNLIFACVSQEILHLAPFFFTELRFNHRKAKKSRGRCPYYSNSCASCQLLSPFFLFIITTCLCLIPAVRVNRQ